MKAAILAVVLAAGVFDSPTPEQEQADRIKCFSSGLCRWLFDQYDPRLFDSLSKEPNCGAHAGHAVRSLKANGIEAEVWSYTLDERKRWNGAPLEHAFVVAIVDGKRMVVDSGDMRFCQRICYEAEALRGLSKSEKATLTRMD